MSEKEVKYTYNNKLIIILMSIIIILVVAIVLILVNKGKDDRNVEIDVTAISQRLVEMSDLSTAKLNYRGLLKYTDGSIPLINKKEFSMIYDAEIIAGIDLSKAVVEVTDTELIFTIPPAKIQNITVDNDSVKFYDSKAALFNFQNREDTLNAIKKAEKEIEITVPNMDLLETANDRARLLIKGLFTPISEDPEHPREIIIIEAEE